MNKVLYILVSVAVWLTSGTASATENVSMMVGDTKTLYLPSSVTSKHLNSVNFLSYGSDCVEVVSHTTNSVKVKALKKTPSAGVIVRCNYTYYILRNGTYVYGGTGVYDWNVKVSGIDPTSVSLPEEVHLQPGESKTLEATLTPSNATTEITWESSSYATVNIWQTGRILAQKKGTSVITVTTSNGKTAQCKVTVGTPDVEPTSISITSTISSIKVGETAILSATVLPADATDKTVTWSSSNPTVIKISSSTGIVTGVKVGYATITAKTVNGLTATKLLECKDNLETLNIIDADGISGTLPSTANVNYTRKFLKGWNTMCVPFTVTTALLNSTSQGLRIATVKEIEVEGDRRNVVLQSVDNVEGGQPCLVYAPADVTWTVSLKAVSLVGTPSDASIMKGSYASSIIGAGYLKISQDGESFGMTKTASAKVSPFRCYIMM